MSIGKPETIFFSEKIAAIIHRDRNFQDHSHVLYPQIPMIEAEISRNVRNYLPADKTSHSRNLVS